MACKKLSLPANKNGQLTPRDPPVFISNEAMRKSISHLCYGDLYVIGRIYIEALRTALSDGQVSLVGVVKAAEKKPEVTERPQPMKPSELPLYGSPHAEYKDLEEAKGVCPDANEKIINKSVQPYVSTLRQTLQDFFGVIRKECRDTCSEIDEFYEGKKSETVKFMRDPKNLNERMATVALGGLTGLAFSYRKGIPSKIFYTGLGLLATGALCFPDDTNKYFRDVCHVGATAFIKLYNAMFQTEHELRGKLPCKDEFPVRDPKKPPTKSVCPPPGKK